MSRHEVELPLVIGEAEEKGEKAFKKHKGAIEKARVDGLEVVVGGATTRPGGSSSPLYSAPRTRRTIR